tara:strand:+ start:3777 stop:4511 length:735 start_codon:yes stop_codon:yes gene_type:complete
MKKKKILLLQARKEKDPMILHEKLCFQKQLKYQFNQLDSLDLIRDEIQIEKLERYDAFIIGGSGDFSVATGGPWFKKVCKIVKYLYNNNKVTFASCWGFQLMAKAMGGEVKNNINQAELGTTKLWLTKQGEVDKIFKNLPLFFFAQMGHEDIVTKLPEDAILLASSKKVKNQAFRFMNKPIYCTQFHPELTKADLKKRMQTYPQYVHKILGISQKEFLENRCFNTKHTTKLISLFFQEYLNNIN